VCEIHPLIETAQKIGQISTDVAAASLKVHCHVFIDHRVH